MGIGGNLSEFAANPIVLSLSKGQRRKAKAGEAANEAGAGSADAGEPDMLVRREAWRRNELASN